MERYRGEIYSRFCGREDVTSVLSVYETHMDGVRNNTLNGVLEMKKKGIAWTRAGIWKLRGLRKGTHNGSCNFTMYVSETRTLNAHC